MRVTAPVTLGKLQKSVKSGGNSIKKFVNNGLVLGQPLEFIIPYSYEKIARLKVKVKLRFFSAKRWDCINS